MRVKRLGYEIVRPFFQGFHSFFHPLPAGEQNKITEPDLFRFFQLAHPPAQFNPTHSRHVPIRDNNGWAAPFKDIDNLPGIGKIGRSPFFFHSAHGSFNALQQILIVVHEQDLFFHDFRL
jgi:hypothetical protein